MNAEHALRQRSSIDDLYRQSHYFTDRWPLQNFTNSLFEFVTVLNKHRQIVFSNNSFSDFLGAHDPHAVIGLRPGEALHCEHAVQSEHGCGTSEFCKMCGAFQAITQSQMQKKAEERECRITRTPDSSALDLDVRATPIVINGEDLTIFSIKDTSDEKRRKALESVFFHDVLNVVGGLVGYSELLGDATPDESKEFAAVIKHLAMEVSDQIESQRQLNRAENNEMKLRKETIHSISLLTDAQTTYKQHTVAQGKSIRIDRSADDFIFMADDAIVHRIIGNLTKNALEATPDGGTVTLGCTWRVDDVVFTVHNPSVIPYNDQLQIFQRSFSTKGTGRGLGTYSVKLFTEKYLGGTAAFKSNAEDGTIFTVTIPFVTADVPSPGSKVLVERPIAATS